MIPGGVSGRSWRPVVRCAVFSVLSVSSWQSRRCPRTPHACHVSEPSHARLVRGTTLLQAARLTATSAQSSTAHLNAQRCYVTSSSSGSSSRNSGEENEFFRASRGSNDGNLADDDARDGAYRTTMPWETPEESMEDFYAALDDRPSPVTTPKAENSGEPATTNSSSSVRAGEAQEMTGTPNNDQTSTCGSSPQYSATGNAQPGKPTSTATPFHGKDSITGPSDAAKAAQGTAAAAAAAGDTSAYRGPWDDKGAGLVRHRVAQWYVPGLEREHQSRTAVQMETPATPVKLASAVVGVVNAALTGTSKKGSRHDQPVRAAPGNAPATPATAVAASAMPTHSKDSPKDHASGATATEGTSGGEKRSSDAAGDVGKARPSPAGTAATTTQAAAATEAKPATLAHSAGGAAAQEKFNVAAPSSEHTVFTVSSSLSTAVASVAAMDVRTDTAAAKFPANTKKEQTAPAAVDKKSGEAEDDDDDGDEELPETLLTVQANRNKRIKQLLMASLGSDFAKAGLGNDGVRTSFSVVNYQTIKQLTGLPRIPSTLLISCMVAPENQFRWIDISMHPTATLSEYKEALEEVLLGLGVDRTMEEDCAEPMLLPQVTVVKGCYSLLMRYAIEAPANKQMDSFQDLTNRFTVFMSPVKVITVHRTQCSYVEELKLNWQHYLSGRGLDKLSSTRHEGSGLVPSGKDESPMLPGQRYLLYYFVKETVGTFAQAISKCIVEFDRYEANLFSTQRNRSSMARDIYHIKRRASVYGRTMTLTQDAYSHIATALRISSAQVGYQEIMHDLAHVESLAEELNSNADSVLQLLFQLSSYQVNELMRVLTVFSAFFIPLSFIASVYGMNFEDLPMLHNEYGGVFCGMLMCTVATCIFLWFRSNRFI